MNWKTSTQVALALLAFGSALAVPVQAQARQEAQVLMSTQVLEELRGSRDQFIPDRLLERAYGIAVIPAVKKGAFGIGARFGRGVLTVRTKDGRFSNPVFVTLSGGSFGWQVGVQETDVVLVFTTRAGVEGITDGKLTLGADASVAAGPVGRAALAATDASLSAEIFSYSRNRGLFAGVALDGTAITIDRSANRSFYGDRKVETADILGGSVTKDSETVRRLLAAIAVSTRPANPSAKDNQSPPAAAQPRPAASPEPNAGSAAQTFPLEDATPGSEPPQ